MHLYILLLVSLVNETHTTTQKCLFLQIRQNKCGHSMANNGQSAIVRPWFGHMTWAHIHGKFKEDSLNTSAVISNRIFQQRRMLP